MEIIGKELRETMPLLSTFFYAYVYNGVEAKKSAVGCAAVFERSIAC